MDLQPADVPKWVQQFMQEVYDMMEAQKRYYEMPGDKNRLKIAKGRESRVREYLKKAILAGAITTTEAQTITQQSIFNQ